MCVIYLFPLSMLPFYFFINVFWQKSMLNFNAVNFINLFYGQHFLGHVKESFYHSEDIKTFPYITFYKFYCFAFNI